MHIGENVHDDTAGPTTHRQPLTPTERAVCAKVADGLTNRQIADELFITNRTAGHHVSTILSKLGVQGRTEAAATAHRLGLTSQTSPGALADQ